MRGSLVTLAVVLALLGTAAGASGGATHHGRPLGLVPHADQSGLPHSFLPSARFSTASFLAFDAGYRTLIDQYFFDVAADSGTGSNVYSTDTQYSDVGTGSILYLSAVGGSFVDNAPLPTNGCNDGLDSVCLTDQQLHTEIQRVLTVNGWHGGTGNEFFLMTPNGVGSCFDSTSTICTTNVYCAYHSDFFDLNGEDVIYANEPYDATITGCDPGSSPNNDDADTELNTISHEHNESITDPFGDAWFASDGNENGDLCAGPAGFGTPLGGTGATRFNQVINGHDYWLQQEFSNADSGCVQSLGGPHTAPTTGLGPLVYHGGSVMHTNTTYAIYWLPTPGNTAVPTVTGAAGVSHALSSSTGSWNGAPTGFSYQWQRCTSAGAGCVNISGATGSAYALTAADAGSFVRSTVSAQNVNGSSSAVASAAVAVVPVPSVTAAPKLSGIAAVGKALRATPGTWNTPATFTYQWLRCSAKGTSCVPVGGATGTDFFMLGEDAGHTFEVAVTATNAAGSTQALTRRSALVVSVPHLKRAPRITGLMRVGRRVVVSHGTWSGPPKSYRYQWLRCNGRGGGCRSIHHATHSTYRLGRSDFGHRLRARVTAVNAAGKKLTTSRSSARVSF